MILLTKILFSVSLIMIFYHLIGYPALLKILSRFNLNLSPSNNKQLNHFVFIIPMYNEELFIDKKIKNLAEINYPKDKFEIILLNDGSTDNTLKLSQETSLKYPELKITIKSFEFNRGKVAVYNSVIPTIPASYILFFSDVSSCLSKNVLKRANSYFNNPKVGTYSTKYRLKKGSLHGEQTYWAYQSALHDMESHLGAPIGHHGAGYAIRRNLWEPLPANTINDDFVMSMRVIAKGFLGIYDVKSHSEEQELSSNRIDWNRRVRISKGNIQQVFYLLQLLSPRNGFRAWMFFSSKVMRIFLPWLMIMFLITSTILAFHDPILFGPIVLGQWLILALLIIASLHSFNNRYIRTIIYFFDGQRAILKGWLSYFKHKNHWERANASSKSTFIHPFVRVSKWIIDKISAVIGLLLLIVLLPFIAIIIKLTSPGPIFYKQLRVGKSTFKQTNLIYIYKLRTMCADSDKYNLKLNVKNDPRIYPFGAFLRKTHIDELPQFYNVLKGEMSLVGPRPEQVDVFKHFNSMIPLYEERVHEVKPGITGFAQIKQGPEYNVEDAKNKVNYDNAYAIHLTRPLLWLKLEFFILFETIKIIVFGKEV